MNLRERKVSALGMSPVPMSEVTYYVALPFVASDDGVAAGEAMECFNPVMRAEALSRKPACVGALAFICDGRSVDWRSVDWRFRGPIATSLLVRRPALRCRHWRSI